MSVRVMSLVWALELPDSEKIVLLALADCANDEGHCWPGMKSLVKKCSKTDRTIQLAIKMLVAKGHLTRREVPGKGCNYTVHPIVKFANPRTGFAPEVNSPPKGTTQTPEAASGKPSGTVKSDAKASSSAREIWKCPEGVNPSHWRDFLQNRKTRRMTNSETAYQGQLRDIAKFSGGGWTAAELVRLAAEKGWGTICDPRTVKGAAPSIVPQRVSREEHISNLKKLIEMHSQRGNFDEVRQCRKKLAELEGGQGPPEIANLVKRAIKAA